MTACPAPRVLIVDDDPDLCDLLSEYLAANGLTVAAAGDGAAMRQAMARQMPDVVVLDLMLPGEDGLSLARELRARSEVGILMLSARGEEMDRVIGLEVGADDYVAKPFSPRELLARVRALLRRVGGDLTDEDELVAQDVRVDVGAHRAFQGQRELQLTAKEFDLLRALLRDAGTVVGRDTLMREVWGSDPSGSTKTLDMHVSWLRRKLGDDANDPHYITTVRGMGFRFETAQG